MDAQEAAEKQAQRASAAAPVAAAASGGNTALRGAFEEVMRSQPGRKSSESVSMQPEWYLAINGEQSGPFNALEAQNWLREQPPTAELFCWADGFDDWLPVEDVPEFREARKHAKSALLARPGSAAGVGGDDAEAFASMKSANEDSSPTDDSSAMNENESTPKAKGKSTLSFAPGVEDSAGLNLDIDDASRVVRLPISPRGLGGMNNTPLGPAGLPGVNGDAPRNKTTGIRPGIAGVATTQSVYTKRKAFLVPVAASIAVVAALAGFMFYTASGDSDGVDEIARSGGPNSDFGRRFEDRTRIIVEKAPQTGGRRGGVRRNPTRGNDRVTKAPAIRGPAKGSDILDLPGNDSGPTSVSEADILDEINRKVNQKSILFTRCHERALKKDPLLKTTRARVTMTVAPDGTVKQVNVPDLGSDVLGSCLNGLMRRWRLSQSKKGITTILTINFARR